MKANIKYKTYKAPVKNIEVIFKETSFLSVNVCLKILIALLLLPGLSVHMTANTINNALCSFKQTRMRCNATASQTQWKIKWEDGLTETYNVLSDGQLIDTGPANGCVHLWIGTTTGTTTAASNS